jgi:hypothetical protein
MEVKPQSVEQFLVEQLDKIAPGRYTLASALQLFKTRLRFPCNHLKGGGRRYSLLSPGKDYNISIFTFPTGVTEIKCLYNCGLKVRSDEKELVSAYNEIFDLPTSNYKASAEVITLMKNGKVIPLDPGPAPTCSDDHRKCIRESNELFLEYLERGLRDGRILPNNQILGGTFPHPDPIEAPESSLPRKIVERFRKMKQRQAILKATASFQDLIPALEPVKVNTKIRKARKTQSRKRGK